MIRPRRARSSVSVESRWFGTRSAVSANQKRDRPVSTRPLSGISVGSTTSKALIRSEATSASLPSGSAYRSRTFPERRYVSASIGQQADDATALVRRLDQPVQPGDDLGDMLQEAGVVEARIEPGEREPLGHQRLDRQEVS